MKQAGDIWWWAMTGGGLRAVRPFAPVLMLALLLCGVAVGHSASVTATLDRETAYLGEHAKLTLTFQDADPGGPPALPAVQGLLITHLGQSSSFKIEGGRTSRTVIYTYNVAARQTGEFTIPAFGVRVGQSTLTTQPLRLRVERPVPPSADAQRQAQQLAFLQLVLPNTEMYVGESVMLELLLYVRAGVQNVSDLQVGDFVPEGFTVGKQAQGSNRQSSVAGVSFTVIPLRYPLTALRAGEWTIGPVSAAVTAHVPAARNRDPFDIAGFFNRSHPQRVALATAETRVRVLPLPTADRPANFTGAVGQFSLETSAGPTNVAVGDPVTLRVTLRGEGLMDQLSLPDFGGWQDFKVYPPTSRVDAPEATLGLRGSKSFEVIVAPQAIEISEVPPLSFSFFDPRAREYRSLTAPPIPLTVRPAGASPPPSVALAGVRRDRGATESSDIVPLKQRLGRVRPLSEPWVWQAWFPVLPALPVAAWLAALGWRKRVEALARNPRRRRRREVDQWLREALPGLRQHAADGQSDEFFSLAFRMLQERLGERLDLPASAITEAVVDGPLAERGLAEPQRAALHELFQRCNEARYAPVRDRQELSDLVPKLEACLREVEARLP